MFARIKTVAFKGIEVFSSGIEVHFSSGLPSFIIVGLAQKAVSEAKERVRSALLMMGFSIPAKKIIINLFPADIQKDGTHYDLGIAVGMLVCMGILKQSDVDNFVFLGELSLNGDISCISGTLPAAIFANGINLGIVCPVQNADEACFAGGKMQVIAASNIKDLIDCILDKKYFSKTEIIIPNILSEVYAKDFSDVKGQGQAKRALEIASIGGHDILMIGRPGSGKSMLAERLPSILPPLTPKEMLEVSIINSISGNFNKDKLTIKRPFRSPHHSSSMVSLVGGGKNVKPGEVTLAHAGVLFLDEFAEFPSFVLESLRQPMETNVINIARADGHISFLCRFQLIAAMNPCKCGYLGDDKKECTKAPLCGESYMKKISGPILERIDIHLHVHPTFENIDLWDNFKEESSRTILTRVIKVRDFIKNRGQEDLLNSKIPASALSTFCKLNNDAASILNTAANKFHLSMRQCHKTIKLARTIADIDFEPNIKKDHILEALQFRQSLADI